MKQDIQDFLTELETLFNKHNMYISTPYLMEVIETNNRIRVMATVPTLKDNTPLPCVVVAVTEIDEYE